MVTLLVPEGGRFLRFLVLMVWSGRRLRLVDSKLSRPSTWRRSTLVVIIWGPEKVLVSVSSPSKKSLKKRASQEMGLGLSAAAGVFSVWL